MPVFLCIGISLCLHVCMCVCLRVCVFKFACVGPSVCECGSSVFRCVGLYLFERVGVYE